MKLSILLIDDDAEFVEAVKTTLLRHGNKVSVALNGGEGNKQFLFGDYDVVLIDKGLPDIDGIKLASLMKSQKPDTLVIIVTGIGSNDDAMTAIKAGCDDYLFKPFSNEALLFSIKRLVEFQSLKLQKNLYVERSKKSSQILFVSGKSKKMAEVLDKIERVKDLDVTVVIQGETGTGKGLVANAIHYMGSRSNEPFIEVNCSALPEQLFESELFGHVKGAFTGAVVDNKGFFIAAEGGTLFLDEIVDMPLHVQPKLLKVIEDKKVTRLGATIAKDIDTRIIVATSKPLEREVAAGRFRSELFYRLNTVVINLPPLRDRIEDIPYLVDYFAAQSSKRWGKPGIKFSPLAIEEMKSYPWPGNVRELKNVVERSIIMSTSDMVTSIDLGNTFLTEEHSDAKKPFQELKREVITNFETRYLRALLQETSGNLTEASRRSGLDIKNLSEKLKRYNISIKEFKGS
ncbi:MAG: sigma-54-dependent transcriptional regulator [Candidatus Kryptoniota bacterium]